MPDIGNSSVFNQADASNASGTMPSWSGAAAPSTLDDAGRALQGAVTREWNWRSYTLTAGGTADAKTLTYSVAPAAYYNGQRFAFIANTTNTTSATLNVNSLGAKTIKKVVAGVLTNLSSGDMVSGMFVEVSYNTANDCFVWVNRGIDAFPAGTAALPSITTTGDANTGFWFPAADTIAASTAGVERMRFKDDATIGIGTSTTNAKLQIDVADYPTNPIVTVTNGASYGMFLNPGNSTILKAGFGTYTNTTLGILTNNLERMQIDASGNVLVNGAGGLGYGTGSGGTVTQLTTPSLLKTNGVTLNKASGQITTNNASLAANTWVSFTVTNSVMTSGDLVLAMSANGNYLAKASSPSNGSFVIDLLNRTGGSLSDNVLIYYVIIRGASA